MWSRDPTTGAVSGGVQVILDRAGFFWPFAEDPNRRCCGEGRTRGSGENNSGPRCCSIGWADGSDGDPRTGDQRRGLPLCCALDDRDGKLTSGVLRISKPATRRELTDMGYTTEVSCMFSMTVRSREGRGA
jgi:hypothetical protein